MSKRQPTFCTVDAFCNEHSATREQFWTFVERGFIEVELIPPTYAELGVRFYKLKRPRRVVES